MSDQEREKEEEGDEFGFEVRDKKVLENALGTEANESEKTDGTSGVVTHPEVDETDFSLLPKSSLSSIPEDGVDADEGGKDRKQGIVSEAPEMGNVYDPTKAQTSVPTTPTTPTTPTSATSRAGRSQSILKKMSSSVFKDSSAKEDDTTQVFSVKYLGMYPAGGLYGIKHTRKPVDAMVANARNMQSGTVLPIVKVVVSKQGVSILSDRRRTDEVVKTYPIDTISYGVQDLVYTRVFSMIVVHEEATKHPLECHGFVCDSRHTARRLTCALAEAFQEYSKTNKGKTKKRFAIDIRTPEEIEAQLRVPQIPDSDA